MGFTALSLPLFIQGEVTGSVASDGPLTDEMSDTEIMTGKEEGWRVMCKCNCVQSMGMRNVHLSRSKGCDYCRAERRLLCRNLGASRPIGRGGEQFTSSQAGERDNS